MKDNANFRGDYLVMKIVPPRSLRSEFLTPEKSVFVRAFSAPPLQSVFLNTIVVGRDHPRLLGASAAPSFAAVAPSEGSPRRERPRTCAASAASASVAYRSSASRGS